MRTKSLFIFLAAGIICILTISALSVFHSPPSQGKGFSAIPLAPYAEEDLRSRGKKFRPPFPNSANKGKKFNPGGEVIPPLTLETEQKILVIFVEFPDEPPGGPASRRDLQDFNNLLFGTTYNPPEYWPCPSYYPTDRTLYNYYQEVSYGHIEVGTYDPPSSIGWVQAGQNYGFYCRPDGIHDYGLGPYPENAQGLVIDAIKAVDDFVDFSQYAVDGEVPNLFVVHAGTGAEWNADPRIIWSHSWALSEGTGLNGYLADDVRINNYAMMNEVGGDLTNYVGVPGYEGPFPPTVGVFAHEFGHVLGLPDEYDYGYESQGVGIYSLMAGGSWNRWPNYPIFNSNSPAHMDAWCKYRLGFVYPIEVTEPKTADLPPVEWYPIVYKMVVPHSDGKEYFLFENRQRIGFDEGFLSRNPWTHGLAIYHVDDVVLNRNYWRPNEAENWKEMRFTGWRKAWTGETHYGISIIQADDLWELEHGIANWIGFGGDLYPGDPTNDYFSGFVTSFGNDTFPNSTSYYFWAGSTPRFGYSGVAVENIQEDLLWNWVGFISAEMSYVPKTPSGLE